MRTPASLPRRPRVMSDPAQRRPGPGARWLCALAVMAATLGVYAATLAPGLTWANHGTDGGDLITAAATLGVPHPSGYPTYVLLARLFLALPFGSPAWRANLLSAVCAAGAAALVTLLVEQGSAAPRRFALAGGLVAGLAFGLSPVLWSQAVIAEVYALHVLLIGLILYTCPLGGPLPPPGRRDLLAGGVFGLALGNHLTTLLLLPAWLAGPLWGAPARRPRDVAGRLALRLAGLAAGLCVYVYLPLAATQHPPVDWGRPVDWAGFWWTVSGAPYRALAFGLPSRLVLNRVEGWASLIVAQFGLVGMIGACYGLFFGQGAGARVKRLTGWQALVFSIFAIGYNTPNSYAYLLPAFLALAVWLGLGLASALGGVRRLRRRRPARLGLAGGLILAVAVNAAAQLPAVDASHDRAAEAFGQAVMRLAPPGALVFTHADRDTFAAWYYRFALGQRPDTLVVVEPLLQFDWYRADLAAAGGLHMPAQGSPSWRQALTAANARAVCDTQPDAAGPALACQPAR